MTPEIVIKKVEMLLLLSFTLLGRRITLHLNLVESKIQVLFFKRSALPQESRQWEISLHDISGRVVHLLSKIPHYLTGEYY